MLPVHDNQARTGRAWRLALDAGTPHRADAEVALHVLDVMESVLAAAGTGTALTVSTTCGRPEPVAGAVDLTGTVGAAP